MQYQVVDVRRLQLRPR